MSIGTSGGCAALLRSPIYIFGSACRPQVLPGTWPIVGHVVSLKPTGTTVYIKIGGLHGLFRMTSLDLVPPPEYLGSYTDLNLGGFCCSNILLFPSTIDFSRAPSNFLARD